MSSTSATESGGVSGSLEATRFPLLELPRELRERIYRTVLRTPASPPSFPVSMEDRIPGGRLRATGRATEEFLVERCNMYPLFPLPSTTSTLLTLNRQVHAEVKEVMSRKETTPRPLSYKLDCMIVDERRVYPTWLSIPTISSSVDVVEANFRLFGDVAGGHSDWMPGDGGPGAMLWSLCQLLNRFLTRGPGLISPAQSTRMKVGQLVLNVVTPDEPRGGFIPVEPYFVGLGFKKREGLIHPETVVREIRQGISLLLHSYHGKTVVESVEVIRICLDGNELETCDIKGRTDYWGQTPSVNSVQM